jgi:hypothetical protein
MHRQRDYGAGTAAEGKPKRAAETRFRRGFNAFSNCLLSM